MEREGEEGSSAKGWSCETNWTVAKGSLSLDASISLDTSDEDTPDLTSDGTLLLRPSDDDPPPCEVTVFFKGKYEIHKVYARTSARIFEIYYTKDADRNSTREYLCTVECGLASSDENLHGSSQSSSVHSSEEESWVDVKTPLMHYEATAEISDAEPCASLTLRFLSLHTNSSVHVEEIYIYSDPIDESSTSTTQDSSTSSNASSLFAMMVPNLLQMSKSGLSSRINERYSSPDRLQNTDVRDQNAKLDTSVTQELSREAVENPVAIDTTLPSLVQSQNSTSPYQTRSGNSSKPDIRQVNQEATVNTDPVKVGPTSNESENCTEKILEQLVSKVEKIETYFTNFEEKMVGPIICIESRLERLENQFDLLTKGLQSMRVPPREEIEKSQDPVSPDDDSIADDVAGCQVETKTCTGTIFKAPECMSEDESDDGVHDGNDDDVRHDDLKVDTLVPNKRKPISIDGALASALAAFATELNTNINTVTSDKMNNPDLTEGVPLVSIDEVDSNLLSSFETVTHTDQNYSAKDITCAVRPTEDSREDSYIHSQIKPGLSSESVIGEVPDEEEEVEAGYAPDPLSSFKAVTVTNLDDENLQPVDIRDINCEVGSTEENSEAGPSNLFSQSVIREVSDEEEVEVGFATVIVIHTDQNYNEVEEEEEERTCEVGPAEVNSEVGPSLFSKSEIGEVSDEEEEVERLCTRFASVYM